jgi:allophanate hydrolase subunit 2
MILIERADAVLIQDRGRSGFADQGVPTSGAWDRERYEHACALIGADGSPVFEVLAGTFRCLADSTTSVAVVGHVNSGAVGHSWHLKAGDRVDIEAQRGPVYVAFPGLGVPLTLGSAASDLVSGLGPDRVESGATFAVDTPVADAVLKHSPPNSLIGYLGTEIPTRWKVMRQARSGTRLAPVAQWNVPVARTLPSRPMLPGAIQIVSSNEAIVLGPDSGVTGGYQVTGVIATADLPRISRLREGEEFDLVKIDIKEAYSRFEQMQNFSVLRVPS